MCAPDQEEAAEPGPPATIYGPTCDSLDLVCQDVPLPLLAPGSWLLWQDMGAYTLSTAGTFNGFPKAAVYPVVATPLRLAAWSVLGNLVRSKLGYCTVSEWCRSVLRCYCRLCILCLLCSKF